MHVAVYVLSNTFAGKLFTLKEITDTSVHPTALMRKF